MKIRIVVKICFKTVTVYSSMSVSLCPKNCCGTLSYISSSLAGLFVSVHFLPLLLRGNRGGCVGVWVFQKKLLCNGLKTETVAPKFLPKNRSSQQDINCGPLL